MTSEISPAILDISVDRVIEEHLPGWPANLSLTTLEDWSRSFGSQYLTVSWGTTARLPRSDDCFKSLQ